MKPDFALSLSTKAIALLHREGRGWREVGAVTLDDPALRQRLAELREAAATLAPDGFTTKLIVPTSQVLYTSLPCQARDEATRVATVRKALDGMTPYPIDELAFDWEPEGEVLHVAVVARETLDEAESFAVEHGFNPVSVVSLPKGGSFTGEPFFGETISAAALLPRGQRVERDVLPTITSLKLTSPIAAAPAAAAPSAADRAPRKADDPAGSADPEPEPDADHGTGDSEAKETVESIPPRSEAQDADAAPSLPESRAGTAPEADAADIPEEETRPASEDATPDKPDAAPATVEETAVSPPASDSSATTTGSPAAPDPEPEPDGPGGDLETTPAAPVSAASEDDSASLHLEEVPGTSQTEADAEDTLDVAGGDKPPPDEMEAVASDAQETDTDGSATRHEPEPEPPLERDQEPPVNTPAPDAATAPPATAASHGPVTAPRLGSARDEIAVTSGTLPPVVPPVPPPPGMLSARRPSPPRTPPPPSLRKVLARPRPPAERAEAAAGEEATPFGRRTASARRRSPLTGFVLTAGLVAFLVAVGLWSALFGPGNRADGTDPVAAVAPSAPVELAATPPEPSALPEAVALPAPAADASQPEATDLAPLTQEADNGTEEPDVPVASPAEEPEVAAAPPAAESDGAASTVPADTAVAYAATGIWTEPPAPPAEVSENSRAERLDAAVDPRVPVPAPLSPSAGPAALTDEPPLAPLAPPPPGTVYLFDDRGLVVPKPEGAPTPEGTVVYSGRPALVPPGRPAEDAPGAAEPARAPDDGTAAEVEAPPDDADASAAAEGTAAEDAPFALPGVPATPARPRPQALVDEAAALSEAAEAAARATAQAAAPQAAADESIPAEAEAPSAEDVPAETPGAAPTETPTAVTPPLALPGVPATPPRPRPAALEAPAGDEAALTEDDSAPVADPALAGFVPRPRPAALVEAGPSGAPSPPASFEGATDLAIAVAPPPRARPTGFSERAAVAAAARAAAQSAAQAAAAIRPQSSPEPDAEAEADGEDTRTAAAVAATPAAAPKLPTRASVANQATMQNAIRLNQTNLIGIYGSSSDRRALVRLSSGRYVKVQVGDRIDGGRVAAISDRELQLVKNGRNVVLRVGEGS